MPSHANVKPKRVKSRVLYLKEGRAYHLCSVQLAPDLSVYIFPPQGSKIIKKFPITFDKKEHPIKGKEQVMESENFKFSYHPSHGLKHFKGVGQSKRLATFNANKTIGKGNLFEPLIRIFPKNPETMPFIKTVKKNDILIDGIISNYRPISIAFHAVTGDGKIEVEGPRGGSFYRLSSFGHMTVLCTAMPVTKKDEPEIEWGNQTIWTTPY